jgi:hypothetical protein
MQNREPDFYLSTAGEYGPLTDPRACWAERRLRDQLRDDYMEVEIDPLLEGQSFGLGVKDLNRLLLASRLEGFTLYPINQWPVPVYVIRVLDDAILASGYFEKNQVEIVAWGMIFRTAREAQLYAKRH